MTQLAADLFQYGPAQCHGGRRHHQPHVGPGLSAQQPVSKDTLTSILEVASRRSFGHQHPALEGVRVARLVS